MVLDGLKTLWGGMTEMINTTEDLRKHLRYTLEQGGVTQIDLLDANENTTCSLFALIINSSIGGNELLINSNSSPFPGQKINVTFPQLGILQAQIIWTKHLEKNIYRLGIEYLKDK
ncbi:hypothetical protein [Gloeothece verrucosa]|uniref:PilZ domain-containing protein n=1 Tax=Gloeothece verrucosa (strain PCC 7822) TaxID=497965 RepID=E0U7W5_GLOV7|nr:hypothetical protein [Gloeothece verrucosa]ADN16052.1 hypothetical protein Cyan7822_4134 [Gloeothece verrucosa PCC 7822]